MAYAQLRLYSGPEEAGATTLAENTVTVPLGEILPLLAEAYNSRRTWLGDFDDDGVTLSADLYDVISAYQHYRRPVA